MSSRRRSFCFLNLLNLALSPFCDDIRPRSSNLLVTQRAEDKSVRSSMRHAADGRCEPKGTLRRNPSQRLRHARSIRYFRKICRVVADSEYLTQAAAVARFPRNGTSGKFNERASLLRLLQL